MTLKVVEIPANYIIDIPNALRELAKGIEEGRYGDAHNVAWVVDCGDGRIEVGLQGKSPERGSTVHLLLALGMRKIEAGAVA